MTERHTLYKKHTNNRASSLGKTSCLTSVMYVNCEYYFPLEYEIDKKIIDLFLNGIKEEICETVSYRKQITNTDGGKIKKVIAVTSKGKPKTYKLFINQIVRYLSTKDSLPIIYAYCELKKHLPEYNFWKLFHIAHLVLRNQLSESNNTYYSYHQPFTNLTSHIEYDIKKIKKNLEENTINNSTTYNTKINPIILRNLIENYKNKNYTNLKFCIDQLSTGIKEFKCIDNKGVINLIENKIYKGIQYNNVVIVNNNDFINKKYKANRFKEIKK